MEDKTYKYDAFISYRHTDLDKFVAENLHKALETYELPKNVKEKLGITGRTVKRIFKDQDELPLSSNLEDPIVDALNNSKYLIVICSPRLKESLWCKKEIETFKKIRGRKNIFCVLIEGEPSDSFPEEVLYDEVEIVDKNGKKKKEKKPVEPLAADVRGGNKKEVLKRIKEEKLRIVAPMFNLDYDDLKQRHKLRKMKKMIYTSSIVAALCTLFAIYSTFMFVKIFNQQKILKKHQAITLSEKASKYLSVDNRHDAIKSSYMALTKFNGVKMPYTSDAEYALSESLGLYNAGTSYKAMDEVKTKGIIDFIKDSYDNKHALSFDESEELVLWDIDKMKKIKSFNDLNSFSFNKNMFTFVGSSKMAYINKEGNIIIASLKDGKILKQIKKVKYSYTSVKSDLEGKYLVINESPHLYLYDMNTYKQVKSITLKNVIADEIFFTNDGSKLFVTTSISSYDINKEEKLTIHVLNGSNLKEETSFNIDSKYITSLVEKNNNIYILSNQSVGNNIETVVTSYNYKNGTVNWTKKQRDIWGTFIARSFYKGSNSLLVANSNEVRIFDDSDGSLVKTHALKSEVINIYVSTEADTFIVFTVDGTVYFVNPKYPETLIYKGLFEFNLDNYKYVIMNNSGYLLVPTNQNRIIYYEKNTNKNIKEVDLKLEYIRDQSINQQEVENVKKTYELKKKNLVKKMIYSDDKKLLFVTYTDNTLGVYDVKAKSFVKMIKNVTDIEYYFGKDKNNRIYVGNITESYILDKNYNKVGHIKSMTKLDKKNNKVIIRHNDKFYESPIYTLDDLLKSAKNYLEK